MTRKNRGDSGKPTSAKDSGPRYGDLPPPADARQALAAAVQHHRAGRLQQAHAVYRRVLEIEPDNADALSLMGLLMHQAGRDDVAVELLRKALSLRPNFAEAHVNLGNTLRQLGRLDEAVDHFAKAVAIKPRFTGAYNNLGLVYQELGKLDESVVYFEKALMTDPRFADAHNNLGLTLQKLGRLDEAIKRYRKALAVDRRFAEAHNNLGTAYRQRGEAEQAIACYRRAIEARPNYVEARINIGVALQEMGKPADAEKHYRKALAVQPSLSELHNNLATALAEQDRSAEAIEHFEKALELKPDYAEAFINLGNLMREEGRLDEAVARYEAALEVVPNSAGAHVNLGVALQEQGRLKEALEHYERAVALKPDYVAAHRNLGIALLDLGRSDKAKIAFHNVLRANHGGRWWNADKFVDVGGAPPTSQTLRTPAFRASTFKLQDTIDQIGYLIDKGLLDPSFDEAAARYRLVLDEVERAVGPDGTMTLTPAQAKLIGGFYNKVLRFVDAPRVPEGALNPELDFAEIEESYLSSPISVTTFDDFLTPQALVGLRNFCLESTIFFGYSEARFVGTDMGTGFNCSLLYQIAEELKASLPRILGEHELSNIWAYRHRNQSVGVEAHTDQGQVTFNFWITDAGANLDSEHGGLLVYCKEQPYDWDWRLINRYKYRPDILAKINDFLASAETLTVPYGNNRALLFSSNLFHKSDRINFAEGYTNRRMNVTMLFGRRGETATG